MLDALSVIHQEITVTGRVNTNFKVRPPRPHPLVCQRDLHALVWFRLCPLK